MIAVRRLEPFDAEALAAQAALLPPVRTKPGALAPAELERGRITSADAAASALREVTEAAVDRALDGTRCVAVLAGGGVDSSALLALAVRWAARTGGRALGVALDFAGPGDDRPYLATVEKRLGCTIVRVRPEQAAHRIDLFRAGVDGAPFTWPGGPMEVEMLARAREAGAERALMGVGADHLFDGDPRALGDVARGFRVRAAVRSARRLSGFDRPRFPAMSWVARPLVASLVPRAWRRRRARRTEPAVPDWAGPTLARVAARAHEIETERALRPAATPRERYERFAAASHLDHLASLRRQESVASGLERRDPFLDPAVVATAARIDPALLLIGDVRRGLFRRAFADLLPEVVKDRLDKAAFEPAFARFAAAAGGLAALRPLADVTELVRLGIADRDRFRAAFERFVEEPEDPDAWGSVWPALAVESFVRTARGRA